MSSNNQEQKPHSAEYFGESRDFWWNADFLELMAKRLSLADAKNVLDVGYGVGHWGQILAPVLSKDAFVTGVDREETWIADASERAKAYGLSDRYRYQRGDATALPFSDNQFDLVTCQTVLIHLKDPKLAIAETLRVLKPGGVLLLVEPNNLANRAIQNSLTEKLSVDEVTDRLRFGLIIERGKQALGLGFNSIGDLVPGYLAELKAENIKVHLSDKATPFFAPYSTKEQKANIKQMKEWMKRGFIGWDREEVFGYFVAGGGQEKEFDRYHDLLLSDEEATIEAIENGTYHSGGGGVTYIITAQKSR